MVAVSGRAYAVRDCADKPQKSRRAAPGPLGGPNVHQTCAHHDDDGRECTALNKTPLWVPLIEGSTHAPDSDGHVTGPETLRVPLLR